MLSFNHPFSYPIQEITLYAIVFQFDKQVMFDEEPYQCNAKI